MRWLGVARRAFDMLCERSLYRYAHGSTLSQHQTVQNWIADSAAEMQAARLMTLHAAWKMDTEGVLAARQDIAMIKYYGAKVLHDVVDRALQAHGSLGYSTDLPLEAMYRFARAARIYDGPDEVHRAVRRAAGAARLRGPAGRGAVRARPDAPRGRAPAVRRPARGCHRERLMARRVRLGLILALVATTVGAVVQLADGATAHRASAPKKYGAKVTYVETNHGRTVGAANLGIQGHGTFSATLGTRAAIEAAIIAAATGIPVTKIAQGGSYTVLQIDRRQRPRRWHRRGNVQGPRARDAVRELHREAAGSSSPGDSFVPMSGTFAAVGGTGAAARWHGSLSFTADRRQRPEGRAALGQRRGIGRDRQGSADDQDLQDGREAPEALTADTPPTLSVMADAPETLLLAAPRGYCAGVDRAVQTVERALELYGAPVYVRKEIVHNKHVVEQLRERGAVFVESETEVPEGATVVFSAHGVAPSVHANAAARGLQTIDATCPLVTKVHVEAKKFAAEGYTIVLVGHAGHEEVEGTMGEAPEHIVLIENEDDVDALEVSDPSKVAYISQTTLSVDETRAIINRPARAVPGDHRSAHRRHLLRDHQPPGGGQAAGARSATSCS